MKKPRSALRENLARLVHSVRFKLSMWYVLILAVVIVIFGSVIYSVEATSLTGEIDTELKFVTEKIPQALNTKDGGFRLDDQITIFVEQLLQQRFPIPEPYRNQLQGIPVISGLLQGKFILAFVDPQSRLTQSFGALDK